MSELHIPDEAISAGWHELRYPRPATDEPGESFRRAVRTAAPIILAAELRRLADEVPKNPSATNVEDIAYESGKYWVTSWIRGRADELERGAR